MRINKHEMIESMLRKRVNPIDPTSRVVLVGGLGSQICGYFFGQYLEKIGMHEVAYDLSEIDRGITAHGVSITSTRLPGYFENYRETEGKLKYFQNRLLYAATARVPFLNTFFQSPTYTAKQVGWAAEHEAWPRGTTFRGEFFTNRYFHSLKKAGYRYALDLRSETLEWRTMKERLMSEPFLSIHLRRGDYKTYSHIFGLLGPEYYRAALLALREQEATWSRVVVFSDDPEHAKVFFRDVLSGESWEIYQPTTASSAAESMVAMSLASHHVIANSSFSMWGAALSPNSGVIVGPRPWSLAGPKMDELVSKKAVFVDADFLSEKS